MEITKPTPIQALAIGPVLEGRDVIAKAETGTGKTLAFGAPIVSRVDPSRVTVLALVMCPTRELAQQVADVLTRLGKARDLRVVLLVGGEKMPPQIYNLRQGAQIVVGTPGRLLDMYQQRYLSFPWTDYVVLDEADRMLEIGFLEDIKKILSYLPETRQTLLFSATFPPDLLKLARSQTKNPVELATASGYATVENIDQCWLPVREGKQPDVLLKILDASRKDDVFIVFCKRRVDVNQLIRSLKRSRHSIEALHGGYDQTARFAVMNAFRTGDIKALIATDVAARGLDITHVTHVVNFAIPRETAEYTHRIGRTGRAGRSGQAITFVSEPDLSHWMSMEKQLGGTIHRVSLSQLIREAQSDASVDPAELRRASSKSPSSPRREEAPAQSVRQESRRPADDASPRRHRDDAVGGRNEPRRPHNPSERDDQERDRNGSRSNSRVAPQGRSNAHQKNRHHEDEDRSRNRSQAPDRSREPDHSRDDESRRSSNDRQDAEPEVEFFRPTRLKPTKRPKRPRDWQPPLSYESAVMAVYEQNPDDDFDDDDDPPRREPNPRDHRRRR